MADDLVKRLREYRIGCGIHCSAYDAREPLDECIEAADRIEKLEAELHHCFHRIEELQAALRILANITDCDTEGKLPVDTKLTWARQKLFDVRQLARKALDAE
jgi:hypothetical protein